MSNLKISIVSTLLILLSLFCQNSFAQFNEQENIVDNPGNLTSSYFAPDIESPNLVILLHGCAQIGEELAEQSGLLGLAKKYKFALLMPQQSLENNIKRCFNWYSANDYARNSGENLSIKNMIMALKQQLSSKNVYIIGLSGGGAMASNMLVNYPDLFNAGAIVAGIPFPCAADLITAISCMKNGPSQTADELALQVNNINPNQTLWPKISVWAGKGDSIVNPLNSTSLAQQWANLSGIAVKPTIKDKIGYTVTKWKNKQQKTLVELIVMTDLGHGIMVNPNEVNGGDIADYLLASPISTAKHIVDFWQLSSINM